MTLKDCNSGDKVKYIGPDSNINNGDLFIVQGFVDGKAVLASIDIDTTSDEIEDVLHALLCSVDVIPDHFHYFVKEE